MKRITISEVVGEMDSQKGPVELCAVAEAAFDESDSKVVIQLDCSLRTTSLLQTEKSFREAWLPAPRTVRESVSIEEASALTREVFQNWVNKVRRAAPEAVAA